MPDVLKKHWMILLILAGLSLLATWPTLGSYWFNSHEKISVPIRVFEMTKALADGHFPVRWLPDIPQLYGYPFFNFYAPLSYYVASFLHLAGMSLFGSLQWTIFIGFFLSGSGMYYFVNDQFGPKAGLAAAVSHIFVPYHLVDIYVRGALAEFSCFAILPFVFLFLRRLSIQGGRGHFALAALSYGLLTMAHNITALFASVLCVVYIVFLFTEHKKIHRLLSCCAALAVGLALSSFYWLPAITEMGMTNVTKYRDGYLSLSNHFVYPWQFFDLSFGFGGSYAGPSDEMSFQLGLVQVVLFLMAAGALYKGRLKEPAGKRTLILFTVLTLVAVFFMLPVSDLLWRGLPLISFIQFPWRLLLFTSFFMSVIAGIALAVYASENHKVYWGVIILLILMPFAWASGGVSYTFTDRSNNAFMVINEDISRQALKTEFLIMNTIGTTYGEYMPKGMTMAQMVAMMQRTGEAGASIDGKPVANVEKMTGFMSFVLSRPEAVRVVTDIIFFPGWRVLIDGHEIPYTLQDYFITFDVPAGAHEINLILTDTPIRVLGNTMSLGALILLMIIGASSLRRKYV